MTNRAIECPHCGEAADVSSANPYRPFCSRRCKLIDLGDWLDESNRIADPDGSAAGATPDPYADDPERSH